MESDEEQILKEPPKQSKKKKPLGDGSLLSKTKLHVTNLPEFCTQDMLLQHFSAVAPVKHVIVVTKKGTKQCTGLGFVQYATESDCKQALDTLQGKQLAGQRLKLGFAQRRQRKQAVLDAPEEKEKQQPAAKTGGGGVRVPVVVKSTTVAPAAPVAAPVVPAPAVAVEVPKRPVVVPQPRVKLIIRNLDFGVTVPQLRAHFEKYANVLYCKIPTKATGEPRGFGFVEVDGPEQAKEVIQKANGNEIGGRAVAVDVCLPKDKFESMKPPPEKKDGDDKKARGDNKKDRKRKMDRDAEEDDDNNENDNNDDDVIEDRVGDKSLAAAANKKSKGKSEEEDDDDEDEDEDDISSASNDDSDDSDQSASGSEKDEDDEDDEDDDDDEDKDAPPRKPGQKSERVQRKLEKLEKRKIFVQNVPLDATVSDIIKVFKQCGNIKKVIIVQDPATGRSRGTCFITFRKIESVENAIKATGHEIAEDYRFRILGRPVFACLPIAAEEAKTVSKKRREKKAEFVGYDKRNIALADIGRIDPESPEWTELSKNDKEKRLNAIKTKRDKLQNPNFIVSTVRLSVRNLPRTTTENHLIHMFASGKKSLVRQVKLVKDEAGVSKGFGFVEFKKHEDALAALKRINNNPTYFGKERRPIVEFAVDDMRIVKAREERSKFASARQKADPEEKKAEEAAREEERQKLREERKANRRKLTNAQKRALVERRKELLLAKKERRMKKRAKMLKEDEDDDFEIQLKQYIDQKLKKEGL